MTIECAAFGNDQMLTDWLANNGGAVASDLCGSVGWSNNFSGQLDDACGNTGSATVTFTATDECGNTAETTATFTVEDTVPPVIQQEASDFTVECDGAGNQNLSLIHISEPTRPY